MNNDNASRVTNSPETIWLVYGDIDHGTTHQEVMVEGEVAWCDTPVHQSDQEYVRADKARSEASNAWQPITTAPKDGTPILAWINHEADPYYKNHEVGALLTAYASHCEALSNAADGYAVVLWGGGGYDGDGFDSYYTGNTVIPDWWFVVGSVFEVAANPTHWMPLPKSPTVRNPSEE